MIRADKTDTDEAQLSTGSRFYRNIILFVATFIFLRPLIILSYTYAEYYNHSTPERWGCNVGVGNDARSLCDDLRSARYLLIPALISATCLLAAVLWMVLRRNRLAPDGRAAEAAQSNHL